ncbi:hypothetical protein Hbl1158_08090 [Halobaculum sp. CBA1158]|uniref:KEOPS complex subunit Pcc1 n=1 Tax=Halobaculum sp. CBA1158 TaxID=2904243 RepID=UPI001F18B7AB|nr:KEOPS complex subunit Pcc1 [Halobaculum sp. CBA1158]UIO98522.1 hypothetical protein Hbl1158_08090 [Halobaculum sp. CBA1158]
MTGADRAGDAADGDAESPEPRTAVVETTHADDDAAATVAAAVSPDNTDDIRTIANGSTVRTRLTRETTGGLLASVDDYLVNLDVADDVVATGRDADATAPNTAETTSDTRSAADAESAADTRTTDITDDADDADDANTHDT